MPDDLSLSLLIHAPHRERALELDGCRASALFLSREYKLVYSVRPRQGTASFFIFECARDGSSTPFGEAADLGKLPFPAGFFDLILGRDILNMPTPGSTPEEAPDAQRELLSALYPHLSRGGKLVIGARNLLSYNHLLFRRGTSGETLRTLRGYHNLLTQAGYQDIKAHLAVPSNTRTRFTCRITVDSLRAFYRELYPRPARLPARIALRAATILGVAHYFEDAYFFEAYA